MKCNSGQNRFGWLGLRPNIISVSFFIYFFSWTYSLFQTSDPDSDRDPLGKSTIVREMFMHVCYRTELIINEDAQYQMNYFAKREEKKKGLPGLLELVVWSDDVWTRLLLPSLFFSLLFVFPCVGFFSAFLFLCSLFLTPCSLGLFLRSWPLVPLCSVLLFPYDFSPQSFSFSFISPGKPSVHSIFALVFVLCSPFLASFPVCLSSSPVSFVTPSGFSFLPSQSFSVCISLPSYQWSFSGFRV